MGQGLVYATGNRGADHMSGDCYEVGRGRIIPELGLDLLDRFEPVSYTHLTLPTSDLV